MNRTEARLLTETVTNAWVDDAANDVVWAGDHEGRWGIRMAQQTRDFTTVWFTVGDLTVHAEAYLLPAPPHHREDVYRYCLAKNAGSWPVAIHADRRGDLFIAGRIPLPELSTASLDRIVGATYDLVDSTFRTLLRMGFESREKSN